MTSPSSRLVPGLVAVAALSALALLLGKLVAPFVRLDATFLALLFGLVAGALARHPAATEPGAQVALKRGLTWGVVLLGTQINLQFLLSAGEKGLLLAALLIAFTLLAFFALARILRAPGDTWALLGAGTGVCGLSAVIAAGASLDSRKEDVAVAAAAVGVLSAIGLLLYPLLGLALQMPEQVYGAWSGLSVHAVANAVAAGFALGPDAGQLATVTKLTRVALLAPALLAITFLARRKARAAGGLKSLLPPMVWGFLAAVLLATLLPIPAPVEGALATLTRVLLVLAMAALGYTTRMGDVRRAGARGLALAVLGWIALSAAALAGSWFLYA